MGDIKTMPSPNPGNILELSKYITQLEYVSYSLGSSASVHSAPNDVNRVPEIPNGYSVHPATYLRITAHPYGQRCPWPPVGYKHQKLLEAVDSADRWGGL